MKIKTKTQEYRLVIFSEGKNICDSENFILLYYAEPNNMDEMDNAIRIQRELHMPPEFIYLSYTMSFPPKQLGTAMDLLDMAFQCLCGINPFRKHRAKGELEAYVYSNVTNEICNQPRRFAAVWMDEKDRYLISNWRQLESKQVLRMLASVFVDKARGIIIWNFITCGLLLPE